MDAAPYDACVSLCPRSVSRSTRSALRRDEIASTSRPLSALLTMTKLMPLIAIGGTTPPPSPSAPPLLSTHASIPERCGASPEASQKSPSDSEASDITAAEAAAAPRSCRSPSSVVFCTSASAASCVSLMSVVALQSRVAGVRLRAAGAADERKVWRRGARTGGTREGSSASF